MFRSINANSDWNNLNSVTRYNLGMMETIRVSPSVRKSFARLLAFYPLSDKQLMTYKKLSKNQKLGFLSKYLIKLCKIKGIDNNIIQKYIDLKIEHNRLLSDKCNVSERKDRIRNYLLYKDYSSVINMYMDDVKIKYSHKELKEYTTMIVNMLIDPFYDNIRKNTNKVKKPIPDVINTRDEQNMAIKSKGSYASYGIDLEEENKIKVSKDVIESISKEISEISIDVKVIEDLINKKSSELFEDFKMKYEESVSKLKKQKVYDFDYSTSGQASTGGNVRYYNEQELVDVATRENG